MYFAIALGLLALVAGVAYRSRLTRMIESETLVTDDLVRQIEASGWVEVDEPLDYELIRDEEDRFLEEEAWDEPDEW